MSKQKEESADPGHSIVDSEEVDDDADSSNDGETDGKRHHKRIMANRRSARASRERRKKLLTDLQEQVNKLRVEAQELLSENKSLRAQLVSSGGLPVAAPAAGSSAAGINHSIPSAGLPHVLQQAPAIAAPSPYATMNLNQMQTRVLANQLNTQINNQLNSQMNDQLNSQLNNQFNAQINNHMNSQMNNQLDLQRLLQSTMAARGLTNDDIIALLRRQHGM